MPRRLKITPWIWIFCQRKSPRRHTRDSQCKWVLLRLAALSWLTHSRGLPPPVIAIIVTKAGTNAVEIDEQIFVVKAPEPVVVAESNHRPDDLKATLISRNIFVLRVDFARLGLCSLLVIVVTVDDSGVDLISFARRVFFLVIAVVVSFVATKFIAVAFFFRRDLIAARELESTCSSKSGRHLKMWWPGSGSRG